MKKQRVSCRGPLFNRLNPSLIFLFFILAISLFLRLYGINWDQGFHLHPDERMIVMVVERLKLPNPFSLRVLFSPESPLNPRFFPYGSFPLYLLKFVSWLVSLFAGERWLSYGSLPFLGRLLSAIFDLGTIALIFKIGKKVFNDKVAILASFFYATCVFPIQASHFYAVDVILNFFIWLTLWQLLEFYSKPGPVSAIRVGICFGLALATKVSATVLCLSIGLSLVVDLILVGFKFWRRQSVRWWQKLWLVLKKGGSKKFLLKLCQKLFWFGGLAVVSAVATFLIFEPYALIDFATFSRQIIEQNQMARNAYVFPYTLQYVGTVPYLYQIKNLVFWGMGIALGLISVVAFVWYLFDLIRRVLIKGDYDREAQEMIVISFGMAYFLTVGNFAVKFMRYLLPLYPVLVLLAVKFLFSFKKMFISLIGRIFLVALVLAHLLWLIAFVSVYSRPHSRVLASRWMNQNLPPGSILAVEHWDDCLPLFSSEQYLFLEMPMYETDDSQAKWQIIEENLNKADYLVLSSNRLYTPLQKLADCSRFKKCYPKTARFYQDLFSGNLGFRQLVEFTSFPSLGLGTFRIEINDQAADESFTVYDHPKVTVFKKVEAR